MSALPLSADQQLPASSLCNSSSECVWESVWLVCGRSAPDHLSLTHISPCPALSPNQQQGINYNLEPVEITPSECLPCIWQPCDGEIKLVCYDYEDGQQRRVDASILL